MRSSTVVENSGRVQRFAVETQNIGRIQIDIPHPELYGRREASVTTGSIESSAFDVSKGGLFRSFEQQGPGKYRLHAHVMAGEIDLRRND